MRKRVGLQPITVLAGVLLLVSWPSAASKNFLPDVIFKGSSLNGWQTIGGAEWRAENGEIIGVPKPGGWLLLDRRIRTSRFFSSFRCAAAARPACCCAPRRRPTAD